MTLTIGSVIFFLNTKFFTKFSTFRKPHFCSSNQLGCFGFHLNYEGKVSESNDKSF